MRAATRDRPDVVECYSRTGGLAATTPAPAAVQRLKGEPGELAWYVSDEPPASGEEWLAYGIAASDERLGDAADAVCQWTSAEVEAVLDDADAIESTAAEPEHRAIRLVLGGTVEDGIGDGLTPIVAERCGL